MADLRDFGNTASANTFLFEEPNTNAANINDNAREVMAAVRRQHEQAEWIDLGHTPTYVSATSITIPSDLTTTYSVNRTIRLVGTVMSTSYALITASAFGGGLTTLTLSVYSGAIDSSLTKIAYNIQKPSNQSLTGQIGTIATAQIADAAVTTAKIADANVTKAKIENVASMKVLGNLSGSAAEPAEVAVIDDDSMATATATNLATSESVKAYVDGRTFIPQVMIVEDQKGSATSGGTFTSGAWQTRTLNTKTVDGITGASLASNQITLPAGTYDVEATAPAYFVEYHKARLYNVTDTSQVALGTAEYSGASGNGVTTASTVVHRFTISGTKVFELQHACTSTRGSDGLGKASGVLSTVETFSRIKLVRVA